MLNGKFYTGLPPDMMGGRQRAANRNPLQSHLFWPDDTKVDSAVETRVKRRTSFQLADSPRLQSPSPVAGDSDVNTKQMFQKEFSKSSIQFCDNLQDNQQRRRPLLRAASMRNDITPKPTAMKLPLPDDVVNGGYSSAKQKQAFTSKIQFYDYVGDGPGGRNNARKPKLDMNDKRSVERNSKNSPKLQVKNNVRNLNLGIGERRPLEYFREQLTPERNAEDQHEERVLQHRVKPIMRSQRNMDELEEERIMKSNVRTPKTPERLVEEEYEQRVVKNAIRPIRNLVYEEIPRDNYYDEDIEQASPPRSHRAERRIKVVYEEDLEAPDYGAEEATRFAARRNNTMGRAEKLPKKILRNTMTEDEPYNDYAEYREHFPDEVQHLDRGMRNVRVRTSPKKHVTYSDELLDDDIPTTSRAHSVGHRPKVRPPNTRTGSNQRQQLGASAEMDHVNANDCSEFMDTDSNTAKKSLNNNKYNNSSNRDIKINNNNNNNNSNRNKGNSNSRELNNRSPVAARKNQPPKMSVTSSSSSSTAKTSTTKTTTAQATASNDGAATESPADLQKHLRSSLCFHDGEIVGSNGGGGGGSGKTPTRSVRNLATQRVSVGLPD